VRGLYIGIQTLGTTSALRAAALREAMNSWKWTMIDTDRFRSSSSQISQSMWFRLRSGPAVWAWNHAVQKEIGNDPYDLVWIDKGVCLWPETILRIRRLARKLIYYTPDASFLQNRSRFFNATASLYDLIITTKSLELEQYEQLVPRERIMLVTQSYDSKLHYPRCRFEEKRKEAVLIGLCEPDREDCVKHLLAAGITVRVGGQGWESFLRRHQGNELLHFESAKIFGDRYAEALSGASVGLGLVTRRFPELHTTRTIEIPACGTLLATERNSETGRFFDDDSAVFYEDYAHLALLLKSLMHDDPRLRSVTEAGYRRVREGAFSNAQLVRSVLERIEIKPATSEQGADAVPHNKKCNTSDLLSMGQPPIQIGIHSGSQNSAAEYSADIEACCIGFLGADWWGSDARAMGNELRHQGHMLVDRNYEDYFPTKWRSNTMRALRRVMRNRMAQEFNTSVLELLEIKAMDFLLVFKGMLLDRKTLQRFSDAGIPCYCVYPDVSFMDHGTNIWDCLPLYDCVFTTKSFHMNDSRLMRRVRRLQFVSHGFDPEVHRPLTLPSGLGNYYGCDVSFVGVWTPKKEKTLASLIVALPEISIKIWGPFWDRASNTVQSRWQGRAAYGDELAAICACSSINLGLLSESGGGTSVGDQTTARTWQIPACGGFMLHEDTMEIRRFFNRNHEVAVFSGETELVSSVQKYLGDDALRNQLSAAGHRRCLDSNYTYAAAARQVVGFHREKMQVK